MTGSTHTDSNGYRNVLQHIGYSRPEIWKMRRRWGRKTSVILRNTAIVFSLVGSSSVSAAPLYSFNIIAEGGRLSEPALDGGTVAFISQGRVLFPPNGGPAGVYLQPSSGPITAVVVQGATVPDLGGQFDFTRLGNTRPSLNQGDVRFMASSSNGGQGVFGTSFGAFGVFADTNMPIPGGTGNFTSFGIAPSLASFLGVAAFYAMGGPGPDGKPQAGVYSDFLRVDTSTPIPTTIGVNVGKFRDFGLAPSLVVELNSIGNLVPSLAFWGIGQTSAGAFNGIYSLRDSLVPVVDEFSSLPGRPTENFSQFVSPSLDRVSGQDVVAFWGKGNLGTEGIYLSQGSSVVRIADSGTPAPGGGIFSGFCLDLSCDPGAFPAIDGTNVAFVALTGLFDEGLYLSAGGSLTRVIGMGDELDGWTVFGVSLFHEGLEGDQIAFLADLRRPDGPGFLATQAIVLATRVEVPEPNSLTLTILGLVVLVIITTFGGARKRVGS